MAEASAGEPIEPPTWRFEPPSADTRKALWLFAGPSRDQAGLERLLDDPYPLALLTARSALARRESRGPHIRTDFPNRDPKLDGVHVVIDASGGAALETWR